MKKVILIGLFSLGFVYWYFFHYQYYKEVREIERLFMKIDIVKDVELKILNYDLTPENVYGIVTLSDGTSMVFGDDLINNLYNIECMNIEKYNEWRFIEIIYGKEGSNYYYNRINLGKEGIYSKYVSASMVSFESIIKNHVALGHFVDNIPEFPQMKAYEDIGNNSIAYRFFYKYKEDSIPYYYRKDYDKYENKLDSLLSIYKDTLIKIF